ncbi:hypothetical protein Pfo_027503 [Paulownia fortunei]|nr:hypothetical protein Pfo_027503 [Paulownia fortunei]
MPSLLLCTATLLLLSSISHASATTLGVTYNPSTYNLPPPEHVVSTLQPHPRRRPRLRIYQHHPPPLRLQPPHSLLRRQSLRRRPLALFPRPPLPPRTHISLISAGSDVITTAATSDPTVDPSTTLLPAMRNLHLSLLDLGIRTIPVSTTFSFIDIMTTSFPPSAAEFQEPIGSLIIRPLLQFLEETNSSFLINLYPYNVYRINSEIPIGFVLFQEHPFNFRDDVITGVRYRNLFDMMVDAVIAAMAVSGQENIPVIVAETGWPSEAEAQAAGNYAEMYLKGLVTHLRSGLGTPLRKEGVAEGYIYQLFDEGDLGYNNGKNGTTGAAMSGRAGAGQHWGIMYPNMTMKYNVDFSGSIRVLGNDKKLGEIIFASVFTLCCFQALVILVKN